MHYNVTLASEENMVEVHRKSGTILLDTKYDGPGSLSISTHGYATINIHVGGGKYSRKYLHRYLLPGFEQVDHINGNRLDNRLENLRGCSNEENNRNKGPNKKNSSGYKGVYLDKKYNNWRAQITVNYKCKDLGGYDTPEEAALVYNEAALKYHGEFAYQNEVQ